MTPEQYDEFLDDLRRLRTALGLVAVPVGREGHVSPREAFRACIAQAERLRTALAHYADEGNWTGPLTGPRLYVGRVPAGGYEVARAALALGEGAG
jgi:hypothetical protein